MREKVFNRLFTVESIVTIMLAVVFAYLAITGNIDTDFFKDTFCVIIAFYFGRNPKQPTNTKTK